MKTAMILAAGRGERLKPITDKLPKPLCKINGKTLIEHHIANLVNAGIHKIVINHAHLGGMIRQLLGNGERYNAQIQYSPEPPGGLETAGGIFNAQHLLGDEPFLVVNGDIYTDYNFAKLQPPNSQMAHLVLIEKPKGYKGDYGLSQHNLIENENRSYVFSGIASYHPQIFHQLKPSRLSVTPIIRQLVNEKLVSGELHPGKWLEIGTPEQLNEAIRYVCPVDD